MKRFRLFGWLGLMGFTSLLSGCLVLDHPLSDISKSEPDQPLVGIWTRVDRKTAGDRDLVIDSPAIEGNPKGLMRIVSDDRRIDPDFWFFVTRIGNECYLNGFMGTMGNEKSIDFNQPGTFARWTKDGTKVKYMHVHYRVEGDTLIMNSGDILAIHALMKKEGFTKPPPGTKLPENYDPEKGFLYWPPPGWLADYLAKKGPGELFPKSEDRTYRRKGL